MTITTKFNLGDTVWAIDRSKAVAFEITSITTTHNQYRRNDGAVEKFASISYHGSRTDPHPERECFKTKEELLNSL